MCLGGRKTKGKAQKRSLVEFALLRGTTIFGTIDNHKRGREEKKEYPGGWNHRVRVRILRVKLLNKFTTQVPRPLIAIEKADRKESGNGMLKRQRYC